MKILVTGAAGFLGSWIAEKLRDSGHNVIGLDSGVGGDNRVERVPILRFDICNLKKAMSDVISHFSIEAVYHCAALAYEGLSVFSPSMVVDNIVGGTVSVATAAIRCGVKRFINCSSMARYGNVHGMGYHSNTPYEENDIPNPVDPYGAAKLAAENILDILGGVHGMKVVHAVPHNIYGPRQKYDDPFRNVAAIFANRMLQGKPPIIYGDGQQVRCFSYIDDVLPTMLALLDADVDHGEVFNVGPDSESGSTATIKELASMLASIVGFRGPAQYVEGRPCEIKVATCSSQKIRKRFGLSYRTLESGLVELVEYIKERGPKPFDYHLPIEIDSPKLPRTWKERMM